MQHGAAVELLASSSMFRGLSGELLEAILQRGSIAHLCEGQTIARAGVPAEAALIILEGTAGLQDENGCDIEQIVGPGAVLCDMAMLIQTSHFHGAVARDAVTILSMSRVAMEQLMAANPQLAPQFAGNIRRNLAATAETLHQLDALLAEPIDVGPSLDTQPQMEETNPQIAASSMAPDQPAGETSDVANGEDKIAAPEDTDASIPEFLRQPAAVASHFSSLVNRPASATRATVPVHDLLTELKRASGALGQTRSTRERDRKDGPSPAPRQQRAETRRPFSAPALPRHGQAAGHG